MARRTRTIEEITDDYSGEELTAEEAKDVRLSVDNRRYVLTLSEKSVTALEKALEPFLKDVQPESQASNGRTARPTSKGSGRTDLAAIRAWAKDNGHTVNDKGRVPAKVIEAYDKDHS